ncbi:putative dynactin Arp1 p62 subunit RO2 [Aspergillus lucknowensis]|uniref:Dynactin subunit 4 n=1 Tax=Aspergillus lucknowensis TaxID=176173 RepID=A0ABR4LVP9_9EURO
MSRPFPYTYISCPCANTPAPDPFRKRKSRESPQKASPEKPRLEPQLDDDEDEQTFDPRAPRSNFSLYPPEQLLYCEDCHQIKCPRCITEEIVCWYCPNCLFETPSSMVRSEGNRCARNCFNCPACTAPLSVTTAENRGGEQSDPWVLSCGYCMWTTLDIGIMFDKPTNIRTQLSKLTTEPATPPSRTRQISKTFGDLKSPLSMYSSIDEQIPPAGEGRPGNEDAAEHPQNTSIPRTYDARFAALKNFYKDQIASTTASGVDPGDFGAPFSSPNTLHRIMSIYTATRITALYGTGSKKARNKPPVMREALSASEGLSIPKADSETALIQRMASDDCGWDGLASLEQRTFQSPDARFVEDLLPLPSLLRTKRSKRCKTCKHILVKPEFKPSSTRYRIRLIALSYVPLTTLRPLILPPNTSAPLPSLSSSAAPNLDALPPQKPVQLLLTLKNHMFDPVRITLATSSVTPGRVASKVTILCPQFDIGANSDVWDEALQSATAPDRSSRTSPYEKVAEAGKVWDRGRNWTTVVLEVVPGSLPGFKAPTTTEDESDDEDNDDNIRAGLDWSGQSKDPGQQVQPDEDVLEIPVLVRMEWDSDSQTESEQGISSGGRGLGGDAGSMKRELAYWMALGVGRIVSA